MKSKKFIGTILCFILLLIIIVVVCYRLFSPHISASTNLYLNKVEQIMVIHPDSALLYLRALDKSALKGEEIKAKYALLYSQALDKNYIDLTNDSIIRIAVDYYSKNGTAEEKAKSYYYLGAIYRNSKDAIRAADAYLMAADYGEECGDNTLLGLIYNGLGRENYNKGEFTTSVFYMNKAAELFKSMGDSNNYISTLQALANSLCMDEKASEAIDIYNKAIELSLKLNDSISFRSISRGVAYIYFEDGDVELAKKTLFNAFRGNSFTPQEYPLLMSIYLESNQLDSAAIYAKYSLESKVNYDNGSKLVGLYHLLTNISESKGDYKEALYYSRRSFELKDSINKINREYDFNKVKNEYNSSELKAQIADTKRTTRIICILMLIIISLLLLLIYRLLQNKKECTIQISNLKEIISFRDSKILEYRRVLDQRVSTLKSLLDIVYLCSKTSTPSKNNLHSYILQLKEEDLIKDLVVGVVELYTLSNMKFYNKLFSCGLTKEEYSICCYIVLGFSVIQICAIIGNEERSLYNKRSIIINKLHSCNLKKLKLDALLKDLNTIS